MWTEVYKKATEAKRFIVTLDNNPIACAALHMVVKHCSDEGVCKVTFFTRTGKSEYDDHSRALPEPVVILFEEHDYSTAIERAQEIWREWVERWQRVPTFGSAEHFLEYQKEWRHAHGIY